MWSITIRSIINTFLRDEGDFDIFWGSWLSAWYEFGEFFDGINMCTADSKEYAAT